MLAWLAWLSPRQHNKEQTCDTVYVHIALSICRVNRMSSSLSTAAKKSLHGNRRLVSELETELWSWRHRPESKFPATKRALQTRAREIFHSHGMTDFKVRERRSRPYMCFRKS